MAGAGDEVRREPEHLAGDERSPLLANALITSATDPDVAVAATVVNHVDHDVPFPKRQILLLCFARIIEPIAYFSIFPFVNQMVQDNGGLPEAEVGFYSGLIESVCSLTQMICMIPWGHAADRFGRKPVLVVSMIGVTITMAMFGFAKTIWQMILFRCMAGVFTGTIVTVRTMLTELSTPQTQARVFSIFAFSGNLGIFIGPLLGGALADPTRQYGGIFQQLPFFAEFPYALPAIVTGLISVIATITTILFVDETMVVKVIHDDDESADHQTKSQSMSVWELLHQPGVAMVLGIYTHVMMLAFAYTAVSPVFWFTSVKLGGFGFLPFQISLFIALAGASQAVYTLVFFTPWQRKYGTGGVMRGCSIAYLFFFLSNPLLNMLLRHSEAHQIGWERTLFWVMAPLLLAVLSVVSLSFTAIQLALNDISPSPSTLGVLNGLALAASSGVRAFNPALFASIFAIGVEKQILGGHFAWLILIVLAVIYMVLARRLPAKAEGRLGQDTPERAR